ASTCTISPASALPQITTDGITIDGYSQSGALANAASWPDALDGTIKIEIDGTNAGASVYGIDINNVNNTILKGLAIYDFDNSGIYIQNTSTGARIQGSYIGVHADGTSTGPNGDTNGVYTGNSVSGAYIGTDGDGTNEAAERNIFNHDLRLGGQTTVSGNYFGVGKDGITQIKTNQSKNIFLQSNSSNSIIGTNGDGVSDSVEGNVFGWASHGITLWIVNNVTIAGNYIGVDRTGLTSSDLDYGVYTYIAGSSIIGTNNDGQSDTLERNIISGNTIDGIRFSTDSTNNTIAGNYIGVGYDGTTDLGNLTHGIYLLNNAADNTIGGVDAESVNVIAYNGDAASEYGVYIDDADTDANRILRNSFFSNQNEGIYLEGNGANDNQIQPVIITNQTNGSNQDVIGTTEA
ncbi:hypothetical protein BVY03_00835, partial [bacterium K02(2017)]